MITDFVPDLLIQINKGVIKVKNWYNTLVFFTVSRFGIVKKITF